MIEKIKLIKNEIVRHLENLYPDYTIQIFTEAQNIPKELVSKSEEHFESIHRWEWFNTKIETNEGGIYLYITKDDEIIATRFLNFYRDIFQDSYEECIRILETDSYLIGNTLIVNPNYRGNGIASNLLKVMNKAATNHFDYVIGCTIEEKPFKLYTSLGAKFLYEEDWEEEHYWYYAFMKEELYDY